MTDQASREALLPCPFCGGGNIHLSQNVYCSTVICRECSGCIQRPNYEGALIAWNTRAALTHANTDTKADNAMLLEAIKANTEVGAINVSLQMELASLRSDLDKANTEMEKMREERDRYRAFFKDVWSMYCDGEMDLESADAIKDIALKFELAREEKYNPEIHGEGIAYEWGCEEGDPIYIANKAPTPKAEE